MILRDYQQSAFDAIIRSLQKGNNPVASCPTGSGKSLIIAALVDAFRGRDGYTLMVTHSKELVQQNYDTLKAFGGVKGVGVYCSGLGESKIGSTVTYSTIQSIYRKLDSLPPPAAIIVDEAHLVAPSHHSNKMYNTLMAKFPGARKIGMSATPWRLDGGLIYEGKGVHFDDLAIDIKVGDLVAAGWLSPLSGIASNVQLNLKGVYKVNGDFDTKQVDERMTIQWLDSVVAAIKRLASDRKAILMFTPTVRVAQIAAELATAAGISAECVHGGDKERDDRIERWEAGEFTLMANCQLLTTGYDRPDIDCIVDCSPTESLGKHIQKLGRGTRLHAGKGDCLVIDVAGNLQRLGGISSEATFQQETPSGAMRPGVKKVATVKVKRDVKRTNLLTTIDPMGGNAKAMDVKVTGITYRVIPSKRYPGKSILLCTYKGEAASGTPITADYFLCVEYPGYPRRKAEEWFNRRKGSYTPMTAGTAMYEARKLPYPKRIRVQRAGNYIEILSELF